MSCNLSLVYNSLLKTYILLFKPNLLISPNLRQIYLLLGFLAPLWNEGFYHQTSEIIMKEMKTSMQTGMPNGSKWRETFLEMQHFFLFVSHELYHVYNMLAQDIKQKRNIYTESCWIKILPKTSTFHGDLMSVMEVCFLRPSVGFVCSSIKRCVYHGLTKATMQSCFALAFPRDSSSVDNLQIDLITWLLLQKN